MKGTSVDSLPGLVDLVELDQIDVDELAARRVTTPAGVHPADSAEVTVSDVSIIHSGASISLSSTLEVAHPLLWARVVSRISFTSPSGDFTCPDSLVREFFENIGFYTLFPYLRQLVDDLGSRIVHQPITMPLLRRGAVHFGDEGHHEAGFGVPTDIAASSPAGGE